jgi:hypothetical protein
MPGTVDRARLDTAFRLQSALCRHFESPFYADLMEAARADIAAAGPLLRLVEEWSGDPIRGFLPLRVFGAVHGRVLAGADHALAAYYPTAGGRVDAVAAWPHFRDLVERDRLGLGARLEHFPQTNEVGRCAGLLGGFLMIAQHTGLPLRLLEIGCSAGLNLAWRDYGYRLGPHSWGDPTAAVTIETRWQGEPPPLEVEPEIHSRAGCDIAPRRIADDTDVRVLESFVWADQPDRMQQLRGAVAVARRSPPEIDRASAGDWLPDRLGSAISGVCDVVYHSSVWIYIPRDERERICDCIEVRGRAASLERPLAWLRHEDSADGRRIEIRLRLWPGDEEYLLGVGHPHGRRVDWKPRRDDPATH